MFLNIHSSFSFILNLVQICEKVSYSVPFCFMAVCIEFIKCSNHGVNNIKVTFGSQKNMFSKVKKAFTVTKEHM